MQSGATAAAVDAEGVLRNPRSVNRKNAATKAGNDGARDVPLLSHNEDFPANDEVYFGVHSSVRRGLHCKFGTDP